MTQAKGFILGTHPNLQLGVLDHQVSQRLLQDFRNELKGVCRAKKIKVIFEDLNTDVLEEERINKSIAQELFENSQIAVYHVDLNRTERIFMTCKPVCMNRNIVLSKLTHFKPTTDSVCDRDPTRRHETWCDCELLAHEIRERVWVSRIRSIGVWPALLICGTNHVENVDALLPRFGISNKILHADFGDVDL